VSRCEILIRYWAIFLRRLIPAIRRIMLTGTYVGNTAASTAKAPAEPGTLTAKERVENYCRKLYETYENYGEVARRTGLDWRTVKRQIGES